MTLSTGSPLWQAALLFVGAVYLLFELWRGWRVGLVRAALNLCALVLSGVLGLLAGQVASNLFGGPGTFTGLMVGLGVGGAFTLIIFLLCWLAGALLFKRTAHQKGGLFRFFWGLGGAFFGLLTGLAILWGGISLIRSFGALAEGRAETAKSKESKPTPLEGTFVTLKESLELGQAGEFLQSVDVIPPDLYELLRKMSRVTSDEQAMLRFIEYPGIQDLMAHPKITALLSDPDVLAAAEKRNFIALMGNKSLRAAAEDPSLAEQLRKVDLRAALDYAVPDSTPEPLPSPTAP